MRHRLDPLIAERAGWLHADTKWSALARRMAEKLMNYDETLRFACACAPLTSADIMAKIGARLAQRVNVSGLHNIPRSGPVLLVANHPTGIADAIILYHCISKVRSDLFIFANSDVLRVLPQLEEVIIPVEWRKERRSHAKTRATMQQTTQAITQQKLGLIFPSGRIAKRCGVRLEEREWMPSAATIARKFNIPVIPIHIAARNSYQFYVLDFVHHSLRDISLFNETLNKDRQAFNVLIGRAIAPTTLSRNSSTAIGKLRDTTMALSGGTTQPPCGHDRLSLIGRARSRLSQTDPARIAEKRVGS